jgi:hypothetical protein
MQQYLQVGQAGRAAHFLYQDSAPDLRKLCSACHRSPARRRAVQRPGERSGPICPGIPLQPDARTGAWHPATQEVLILHKVTLSCE